MSKTKNESESYQCKVCMEVFVVPSLARHCELKHSGVVTKTGMEAYLESLENPGKNKNTQ